MSIRSTTFLEELATTGAPIVAMELLAGAASFAPSSIARQPFVLPAVRQDHRWA